MLNIENQQPGTDTSSENDISFMCNPWIKNVPYICEKNIENLVQ